MNPAQTYDVAEAALAAIVSYYQDQGHDLPDRQLVVPGLPPWDCELLAVQVETVAPIAGDPSLALVSSLEGAPEFHMRGATLGITVAWCVTLTEDGSPAPVTADQAVAAEVLADMGRCWNALADAQEAGLLPCCGGLAFVSWQGLGPEGGLVGGLLRVAVSLE